MSLRARIRSRSGLLRPLAARSFLSPSPRLDERVNRRRAWRAARDRGARRLDHALLCPRRHGGLVAPPRQPPRPAHDRRGLRRVPYALSLSTNDAPFHARAGARSLPPVVFLHVFLAFPSGRLRGRFERAPVVTAMSPRSGPACPDVVRRLRPAQPARGCSERPRDRCLMQVQLVAFSAFCLCGVGVLALGDGAGRPLRRSLALLVDSFALGLVMIAFSLLSAAFGGPAVAADPLGDVRDARARAARLPRRPPPRPPGPLGGGRSLHRAARGSDAARSPRRARARASRSLADARVLAAGVRQLRRPRRPAGGAAAIGSGRATTLIERDGVHVAALLHDPALEDEPELLDAVTAAAGIALENARLHVELRARLEELRGSRARMSRPASRSAQRLERNLHDGAQQRLVALSLELSLLEEQLARRPGARGAARPGPARDRGLARRAAESPAVCTPPWSAGTGSRSRSSSSSLAPRFRSG